MTQFPQCHAQVRRKRSRIAGFAVAVLWCALPGSAQANTQTLPKTFITIPAAPADVAGDADGEDLLLNTRKAGKSPAHPPLRKRNGKLKVLSYSRDVEVGKEEVQVKLQSPGSNRSIMSLDFRF